MSIHTKHETTNSHRTKVSATIILIVGWVIGFPLLMFSFMVSIDNKSELFPTLLFIASGVFFLGMLVLGMYKLFANSTTR